jgi:hypothetical protein
LELEKWFTDWVPSGSETFEGVSCDRLYARGADGNRVQVFLRKDTRRLLGLRLLAPEPTEHVTLVFESWTSLSGLALPERVVMSTSAGRYVATLSAYRLRDKALDPPEWAAGK